GLITNAGPAHLEGFGSVEGVANAKGELFAALGGDDIAVINADDRYAPLWHELAAPARVCTFGLSASADCSAREIAAADGSLTFTAVIDGAEYPVRLPVDGRHNVANACAALAAAVAAGAQPDVACRRIAGMTAAAGRLNRRLLADGTLLIDDSYNANPSSMRVAATVAQGCGRPVWAALGDMGELGPDAERMHAELGADLAKLGVERLFAHGPLMRAAVAAFGNGGTHFDDIDALTDTLLAAPHTAVTVLVKGSRAAGMERVVAALARAAGGS
ncbi:MAG: UDP-N-acetylmuramoyl-tripeptide--D-alanyl-D-alanine ligase, partial [Pseudomonadota bacterium]